jgi:hypothetical protein
VGQSPLACNPSYVVEDELQTAVNELNKIVKKYDMKMSTTKTKTIGLCGKNIQRVKI